MTFGTQTTFAERLARMTGAVTIATSSDATKTYLNEGVREFAKRAHGIRTENFMAINPRFDADTNFAINLTFGGNTISYGSANVALVSSTLHDVTPTTLAAHMTSNVNAVGVGTFTISFGWSASTWTFYLTSPASVTNVVLKDNTFIGYVNAMPLFFGTSNITKRGSTTITTAMGAAACLDTSLPTGFLEMKNVYYGTRELQAAPFANFLKPQAVGAPIYYAVENKTIYLNPVPVTQDYFRIFYAGLPTDLGVDGSSDSVACPLPEEVHMAPVYYAAACLLEEGHEFDKSVYYQRKFNDFCSDYKIREANNNPTMFPNRTVYQMPIVTMSSI